MQSLRRKPVGPKVLLHRIFGGAAGAGESATLTKLPVYDVDGARTQVNREARTQVRTQSICVVDQEGDVLRTERMQFLDDEFGQEEDHSDFRGGHLF